MAAPATQMWCILVDPNFQSTVGNSFRVRVPSDGLIEDLMDKIKERKQNKLAHVDADDLEVWKLRNPRTVKEVERAEYLQNLRRLDDVPRSGDEGDEETAWRVRENEEILSHFSRSPKAEISALVRMPVPLQVSLQQGASSGDTSRECSIHLLTPAYRA